MLKIRNKKDGTKMHEVFNQSQFSVPIEYIRYLHQGNTEKEEMFIKRKTYDETRRSSVLKCPPHVSALKCLLFTQSKLRFYRKRFIRYVACWVTTKHPPVRVTSYVWRLQDGLPFTIRYFLTATGDPCVQDTFFDNYKKSFRSGCVIFWQLQEVLPFRIRFLTTIRSPSVQNTFIDDYNKSFRSGYTTQFRNVQANNNCSLREPQ